MQTRVYRSCRERVLSQVRVRRSLRLLDSDFAAAPCGNPNEERDGNWQGLILSGSAKSGLRMAASRSGVQQMQRMLVLTLLSTDCRLEESTFPSP